MSARQVLFEDVFDGSVSFALAAVIGLPLHDVVSRWHFQVSEGDDGLDGFTAVPLALDLMDGRTTKFALWRHQGNPEGTFAIHLALPQVGEPGLVDLILEDLGIPEQAVSWRSPVGRDAPSPDLRSKALQDHAPW